MASGALLCLAVVLWQGLSAAGALERRPGRRGPQLLRLLALEKRKPKTVVANKGYDSQLIRKALREQSISAQIPERGMPQGSRRKRKGRPPKMSRNCTAKETSSRGSLAGSRR